MIDFLSFLKEATGNKHGVIAVGRMNPPTTGHMQVISKVDELAQKHNAEHKVVVTHSQDANKNPLSASQKVKHLKRYSGETNVVAGSKEKPNILFHASDMHKSGVTHLHVVAGSDRVEATKKLLNDYNGKEAAHGHYNFKKITVHSSGKRDADAEGTSGMSGTKMRDHAKSNNFKEFRKGVPAHVSDAHAHELMHDVQQGQLK